MLEQALLTDLLSIASGSAVGFSLGLIGGGGSILAVPLLVYLVGVPQPHIAIGTSALAVGANAAVNLISHGRKHNVHWRCAGVFAGAGIVGALIGSSIGIVVDGQKLLALFSLVMFATAIAMLRSKRGDGDGTVHLTRDNAAHLLPRLGGIGLLVGTLSGFFGIGGGFLVVPGLILATGTTMIRAIGSSLVAVAAFGFTTAANYALAGLIDWWLAALFLAGGVGGGVLGSLAAQHLASHRSALTRLFAGVIFVVGVYVLVRGIMALTAT